MKVRRSSQGMRFTLFFLFLMVAGPCAAVCEEPVIRVESPEASEPIQKVFRNELSLVARNSAAFGEKRFSKYKKINDSYQLTSEAIQILAENGDVVRAIPLLREASRKYDGNRMAYLLLGSALERTGDRVAAAHAYADFYIYSLTMVPFERELIGPSSLEIFRGYVEKRFSEWGMTLPRARVGFELQRMRSLVMLESSPTGQRINLVLPILVLVGLAVLILTRMTHMEFPETAAYFLVSFYVLLVLGYLLWTAHLFLGLPFLRSIEAEYALLFGGGGALICLLYAANCFFDFRPESKGEDSKACPHCRAIILRVSVECPFCKRACRL